MTGAVAKFLRPGFVHSQTFFWLLLMTLALAAVSQLTDDYWRIGVVPFVAVAIYAFVSGDKHLPGAEGDQQQPQSIEKES